MSEAFVLEHKGIVAQGYRFLFSFGNVLFIHCFKGNHERHAVYMIPMVLGL